MNKITLLTFGLLLTSLVSIGQWGTAKTVFIVDSIPVINDPEDGDDINPVDIAEITVIRNKDSLKMVGYEQFDAAIFIFTKEYRARLESVKMIPSIRQMVKENGAWLYHGAPYNGPFIDYYYSGRKEGIGKLLKGKLDGPRFRYFQNGKIMTERIYKDGLARGPSKEYYEDGSLKSKGDYVDNKEDGVWYGYFPNGQLRLYNVYHNGEVTDSAITYYSNGKTKEKVFIKKGKVIPDPALAKLEQLLNKSSESYKAEDMKGALKYCSKAIELDSGYVDAYFTRGTLKLDNFQFDDAIADFDKALQLEPYMAKALTNRAFARIRKYEFGNSRTLLKNSDVTVLASKDKVYIPPEPKKQLCDDLDKAQMLGDRPKMSSEAKSTYCKIETHLSQR